jgi:flavin reductase (DIM6/NTAB) family NADH-FMN oxidoreductase RutF
MSRMSVTVRTVAEPSEAVELVLEELWSPIAALTAAHGGRANGLIVSTAVTASLLPEAPRISVVLSRSSLTHDLVLESGGFALHLLAAEPVERSVEVFRSLGFRSGRDGDKLTGIPWRAGETGAPILEDALAYVETRVAATLDAGDATLVLADIVAGRRLRDGPHLRIDEVRRCLTEADWARWDERRTEELHRARQLRE